MFIELQTSRLKIRPVCEDDSEVIFEKWAQDADVTKYMTWKPHHSIEETKQHIKNSLVDWDNNSFTWVIELKGTKEVIGSFAARQDQHKIDIGYLMIKSQWGKGYMTELLEAFIHAVFKDENIKRVWAVCDVENKASKRVMEKAGMTYEGILKSWLVHSNMSPNPRDCYCLSVIK